MKAGNYCEIKLENERSEFTNTSSSSLNPSHLTSNRNLIGLLVGIAPKIILLWELNFMYVCHTITNMKAQLHFQSFKIKKVDTQFNNP